MLIALLLLASPLTLASSQSTRSEAANPEPKELADDALEFAIKDDMAGLFAYMGKIMPMDKAELEKLRDNIIAQRKAVSAKLGGPTAFVLIAQCRKSETLTRLIYAEKRSKSVMRWEFIFYKPRDKWTLIYFHWDDKFTEFFQPCN